MGIYEVPEDRRYWVVRCDGGGYYDHFVRFGIIALGHLDDLNLEDSGDEPFLLDREKLENSLKDVHDKLQVTSRRTSVHFNQVKSFIAEMSVGDWVLTISHSMVRFGRVTGKPRLKKEPLRIVYDAEKDKQVVLRYNLRRTVIWGPSIKREDLPFGLLSSLRANQTLFNIDQHWDAVHHSLYPVFRKGSELYLSAKINTKDKVRNYSVVSLLAMLNEIEVIAKEFDRGLTVDNFDEVFDGYVKKNKLTVTTKAEFHSPGEIWNALTGLVGNLDNSLTYAVLAYGMIFGNQKLGFDGVLDLQTRQKLWELVIERMQKKNIPSVVKSLELTVPKAKTEKLESAAKDELDTNI